MLRFLPLLWILCWQPAALADQALQLKSADSASSVITVAMDSLHEGLCCDDQTRPLPCSSSDCEESCFCAASVTPVVMSQSLPWLSKPNCHPPLDDGLCWSSIDLQPLTPPPNHA